MATTPPPPPPTPDGGGRPRRRLRGVLLLGLLAAAVALALTGHGDWLVAAAMGLLVAATGLAVFRGYSRTRGPVGPPEDVQEAGTLLVYACQTCGEQLILLRKGTDQPPRHCADPMVLRRVPTPDRLQAPDGSEG
jgi:hypothetical protein